MSAAIMLYLTRAVLLASFSDFIMSSATMLPEVVIGTLAFT